MSLFGFYGVEETDSANSKRRKLAAASADPSDKAVAAAMGTFECDTDGVATMGRTVHNAGTGTVDTTPVEALPAYAKRTEAVVQNVDQNGGILFAYLAGASSAKFILFPGGDFRWSGADQIMVVTTTGTADWVAVDR